MKNLIKLFVLTAAAFIFSNSQAQFYLGAKGGITIPNLTAGNGNPISSGYSSRLGPYFGIVAEDSISKLFSLQVELNYSSQGGKKNGEQTLPNPLSNTPQYLYASYKTVARLNYLELPLLAKFSFPLNKSLTFFVNVGPYFDYLINANQINTGASPVYLDKDETQPIPGFMTPADTSININDQINRFNVGVQGGLGLSLKAGSGKFIFTAGGNYGFLTIQKNSADGDNKTGAATITLGYLFKL